MMSSPVLTQTFTAQTDAVGGSLLTSALVGLLPLLTFFVLLGVVKVKAHVAALGSLAVALLVAVLAFGMPAQLALLSATQGAVFGLFPILWIVITAIWLYQLTVISGRGEDVRAVFSAVGRGDMRVQAMLIAFCFGGLLEALAGFGAPVAITGAMLVSLGLPPLRAAVVVLVANTAPVAFGAMAIPITTAGNLTGIPATDIAAIVGHQTPLLAAWIPLLLLFLVDGVRGVRQVWPVALVTGGAFAVLQWWASNHFSYELTDVVAALGGFAAAVALLAVWHPKTPPEVRSKTEKRRRSLTTGRVTLALMPYWLVVVIFGIGKLWRWGVDVPAALASTDITIQWPGLYGNLLTPDGEPSTSAVYTFTWLSSPGTMLLITGLIVTVVYALARERDLPPMSVGRGVGQLFRTIADLRWPILTISSILSLSYVMNQSGQTISIGAWLAATGSFFAFLSPILGWLGTAVTGSDTSANALFAKLQQTAGQSAGINPDLLVAANTSGGVVGKLISPQNLTIAATAIGEPGSESVLLRKVIGYSLGMLLLLCILVYLQSTPVLGWMVG
ncbi:L-lactate permease [Georgenia sp. TF02-10]|uniref:L-lactate permease n=1 Tax=Georgenia sp. TF02-10 TaxID=2917725 RepID=UPI001FA79925|nr:L-lactate permease [Georgenia sp. TF02-10]UNX55405.1 L-lactate permease [Georgenia sp. TF02-10]